MEKYQQEPPPSATQNSTSTSGEKISFGNDSCSCCPVTKKSLKHRSIEGEPCMVIVNKGSMRERIGNGTTNSKGLGVTSNYNNRSLESRRRRSPSPPIKVTPKILNEKKIINNNNNVIKKTVDGEQVNDTDMTLEAHKDVAFECKECRTEDDDTIKKNNKCNSRVKKTMKKYEAIADFLMQQQQQRGRLLNENIIHFPMHIPPSDKARCHQMQRSPMASITTASARLSSTTSSSSKSLTSISPTSRTSWSTLIGKTITPNRSCSAAADVTTRGAIVSPIKFVDDTTTCKRTKAMTTSSTIAGGATASNDLSLNGDKELFFSNNLTLRKVAETMCLKDVQYKPMRTDHNGVKSNPFTALSHLRCVKKMLGANPKVYAAGVSDLFSSCFEISEPFFKETATTTGSTITSATNNNTTTSTTMSSTLNKDCRSLDDKLKRKSFVVNGSNLTGATITTSSTTTEAKSLPTSPQLSRKYNAMVLKMSNTVSLVRQKALEDDDECPEDTDIEQDIDGGGNCADGESSSDDSDVNHHYHNPQSHYHHHSNHSQQHHHLPPVTRKYRANSLFTHPLFRGNGNTKGDDMSSVATTSSEICNSNQDDFNSSEDGCEKCTKIKSFKKPNVPLQNNDCTMSATASTTATTLLSTSTTLTSTEMLSLTLTESNKMDTASIPVSTITTTTILTATGNTMGSNGLLMSSSTPPSLSSYGEFEVNDLKTGDLLPSKNSLTRRDSIESGFYSCFNEEPDVTGGNNSNSTCRQLNGCNNSVGLGGIGSSSGYAGMQSLGLGCHGGINNCCFDQLKSHLMLDVETNGELW